MVGTENGNHMSGVKRGRPSATPAAGKARNGAAGPGPGSVASGLVALHRSRMFEWKPSAVVVIAPCPGAPLFAVGYESGSVELWDMLQLVCIQTVVGPSLELTSIAWVRDVVGNTWRTFAAFLDGTLAEVLWAQSSVAHFIDSYGGVVWALAASPASTVRPGFSQKLAAACDDGSVRMFGCEDCEPGLFSEQVLTRLEGRLLTIAWHAGGTMLVVGSSAGNMHLLDAVTGRENQRITVSAATTRPVTVWRVLSLPDNTIVSGDSDGAVQMWDGRFGTLLKRFTQHRADVLALAVTEDGTTVFAAGVDSQVAMFVRTGGGSGHRSETWVYTHYKRPHTHDVRALALLTMPDVSSDSGGARGAVLLSGGVDAQLMAYPAKTFLQEYPHRLCKCPQRPMCQVATAAQPPPRLLIAQHDTLDIWRLAGAAVPGNSQGRLGHGAPIGTFEGSPLELKEAPRHLVRIRIKGARIAAASISPSGTFLACTTPAGTRAYSIANPAGGNDGRGGEMVVSPGAVPAAAAAAAPLLSRLKLPAELEVPAIAVAVTDTHLVMALRNGGLVSYDMSAGTVTARRNITVTTPSQLLSAKSAAATAVQQAWRSYCPTAAQLVVSADGSLLAAVGGQGIMLYRLPDLQPHVRPLHADSAFTAAAFSHDGHVFAATTSACQLFVWETSKATAAAEAPAGTVANGTSGGGGAGGMRSGECHAVRWSTENTEAVTAAISRLPGTPTNISFCPAVLPGGARPGFLPYRLVVNSPGGLVHLDLSRQVLNSERGGDTKGRRHQQPQAPSADQQGNSQCRNGRVIHAVHPAVWVGHVGPSDMLLLEKPWPEVLQTLPPPLFTQRYGT